MAVCDCCVGCGKQSLKPFGQGRQDCGDVERDGVMRWVAGRLNVFQRVGREGHDSAGNGDDQGEGVQFHDEDLLCFGCGWVAGIVPTVKIDL